ncbi:MULTISPECIES: hypothetical protein [unclassified Streptomyces]|uniref:hypothetical protein n=1 Tax=unclassified Streptomyces TaxID=2593676 RepID=UPI00225A15CE|nr:hypothetical protein [Streptomyces sp. NBC_00452]MCX5056792.1 hypothetical protein [Streptomyces sp. NBC_00452]
MTLIRLHRSRVAATAIAGIALAACAWTTPAIAAPVAKADDDVYANCKNDTPVRSRPDYAGDDILFTCPKSTQLRLICWTSGADQQEYYAVATGIPNQEIGYVSAANMNNETGGLYEC